MQGRYIIIFISLLLLTSFHSQSQDIRKFFREVELKADTSLYTLSENTLEFQEKERLAFEYKDEEEVCEVKLYPADITQIDSLVLLHSGDFDIVDSLLNINGEYFRFKVNFHNLNTSNFVKFTFQIKEYNQEKPVIVDLNLLPYHATFVRLYPLSDELYIGEEKVFELITNNIDNVRFNNDWQESNGFNYRLSKTFNQLQLHIIPNSTGQKTISIPLQTKSPNLIKESVPVFDLPPVTYTFNVRQSRLQYLGIDKREVTFDDSTRRQGIEVQLENSRLLRMEKTYRIEDQEQPGSALIAELYTRNLLTNNRVLCILRVYNYHRESEGYLFIKDGDQALFITNFNITPKTRIDRISILRNGNWTENLDVYPNEVIDLKIEGQGLHKARFTFEELIDITTDTTIRSENLSQYKFRVPMDVTKKSLNLFNWANNTGYALNVREYQEPRTFDFLYVNYDGRKHQVSELPSTILVDKTISDVIFSADRSIIDSEEKMYGKQYLQMEITITGGKDELLEIKTIDNIVICPDVNSPRYEHYPDEDCGMNYFNLNQHIRKKTHALDLWSRINIKVSHRKEKYDNEGFSKEFELIIRKDYSFDIEVSFPAGLITVSRPDPDTEDDRFGQLSGISIAMIAQFTFYHPDKINSIRPYKIGAGFLALNTFNFSDTGENRDIGIVILGSLYPARKDAKLTFPLYFGGGYLLKDTKFFLLLGPGIRIKL
jgi:hypothetical protein